MGGFLGGGTQGEDDEEEEQRALERWRPAGEQPKIQGQQQVQLPTSALAMKRKGHSASSESSEDSSGGESQSGDEAGGDKDDEDKKSEGSEAKEKEASDEEAAEEEEEKEEEDTKKQIVRMEFTPLLSLLEPLRKHGELDDPAKILAAFNKRSKTRSGPLDVTQEYKRQASQVANFMADMGREEINLMELAQNFGSDPDEFRYIVEQSGQFQVDENGVVRKSTVQRILDAMESEVETVREIMDRLGDVDEAEVAEAVQESDGMLKIKEVNGIKLIEDLRRKKEAKEDEEEPDEPGASRRDKKKKKKKAKDDDESSDGEEEVDGDISALDAEKKAMEFRRVQVQRKVEEFLKIYTRGQNLTKINAKGKRYHRRVYVDTAKRSLVVQGAGGPKFFPFASMKEVDTETRTTKEGRVETLVICAIERGGRIVKELTLSFPDQAKASNFANCVTLFSVTLRNAPRGQGGHHDHGPPEH